MPLGGTGLGPIEGFPGLGTDLLGGTGMEGAPAAPSTLPDADQYVVKTSAGNPEGLSGSFRYDWQFKSDGMKAYTWRTGGSAASSFREYTVATPWALTGWSLVSSTFIGGGNARTFEWSPDGTVLCTLQVWFSSNRRLINYDQSATPWASAVLGVATVGQNIHTGSFTVRWRPDGKVVYIAWGSAQVDAHTVAVAFDASTLTTTPLYTFNGQPDAGSTTLHFAFSTDGTKLYSRTAGNLLCTWDLLTPWDLSTATNFVTGVSVVLPTALQVARGMYYRPDNGDLFMERDQSSQNVRCWEVP